MAVNGVVGSLIELLHFLVLIFLFGFLFIKICTLPGRWLGVQLALIVAFFGVCTMLGYKFAPAQVNGLWVEIGRLAMIVGWLSYIFLEARRVNC